MSILEYFNKSNNIRKNVISRSAIENEDEKSAYIDYAEQQTNAFYEKIRNIAGIPDVEDNRILINDTTGSVIDTPRVTQSLYDAYYTTIRDGGDELKKSLVLTHEERLSKVIFSMKDIESLFFALSLGIGDPGDRTAIDNIFTNWKNDQLASIK